MANIFCSMVFNVHLTRLDGNQSEICKCTFSRRTSVLKFAVVNNMFLFIHLSSLFAFAFPLKVLSLCPFPKSGISSLSKVLSYMYLLVDCKQSLFCSKTVKTNWKMAEAAAGSKYYGRWLETPMVSYQRLQYLRPTASAILKVKSTRSFQRF